MGQAKPTLLKPKKTLLLMDVRPQKYDKHMVLSLLTVLIWYCLKIGYMEYPQLMPIIKKKTRENVCCDLMLVGEYVKKQGWRMYCPLHLCSWRSSVAS